MRIVDVRVATTGLRSDIRNAYVDFSRMTASIAAVVTDAMRDGRPVTGFGFNSNRLKGTQTLCQISERVAPSP